MAGTPEDFTYARKGHITVEVGDVAAANAVQETVHSLGCITGDFTVNDSFAEEAEEEFDNWCAHIAAQQDPGSDLSQVALGQRTIDFSPEIEMDLSDPNYATEYDAYKSKTPRQFQLTWENDAGDVQELFVNGVYTQWNRTGRDGDGGAGTARVAINFHANSIVTDTITPAA